jgi:hypothetical protein
LNREAERVRLTTVNDGPRDPVHSRLGQLSGIFLLDHAVDGVFLLEGREWSEAVLNFDRGECADHRRRRCCVD